MASVSDFLIERLENAGVKHVFGVAGDYILNFFSRLADSKLVLVNTADEAGAGFAADGYARMAGIGCVAVTYNVGAFKICNPIAGAYAERSPVIVISGAPRSERGDLVPHHVAGGYDCQREVFKKITCAQAILDDPTTAGYEIDRVFEALKYHKQPVYIELARDVAVKAIQYDVYTQGTPRPPATDGDALEEALAEVTGLLAQAKTPVILAGVEIARYGVGRELIRFAERANIPVACTLLSKSVVNERHPLYVGVYAGSNSSKAAVREMVEKSDCLLVLGETMTEATFGYRQSKVYQKREMVTCCAAQLKVRGHQYTGVWFPDFCQALFRETVPARPDRHLPAGPAALTPFAPTPGRLTTARLFEKINTLLADNVVVVADTGDALLGASDLVTMNEADAFLGPAFYLSMGFAIPAGMGAALARPKKRPIIIVGDGAFQMSLSEISTMIRLGLRPIIFVLNNGGYTTERMIADGPFNDIQDWHYHRVPEMMGGGQGFRADTEADLEAAVGLALTAKHLTIINCVVNSRDVSPALSRIGIALAHKNK